MAAGKCRVEETFAESDRFTTSMQSCPVPGMQPRLSLRSYILRCGTTMAKGREPQAGLCQGPVGSTLRKKGPRARLWTPTRWGLGDRQASAARAASAMLS